MITSHPFRLLPLLLLVAGCDGTRNSEAPQTGNNAALPAKPAMVKVAENCAPVPGLELSDSFADPQDKFGTSGAFSRTEANFRKAYDQACAKGLLKATPLMDAKAARRDTLFLASAPETNLASIFLDTGEAVPSNKRVMKLEYAFIQGDGSLHVPTAEELGEAIYCRVHGATDEEQETSGRCLPD